jgi:hypothetical protein
VTLTHKAIQSFRHELDQLWEERLTPVLLLPLLFIIVWIVECVQKYAGRNLDPQFWAFIALLVTVYGGFEIFRLRPRFRNPRRGQRRVTEILNRIRANGFVAYHGLLGKGFNIDHVVVGPSGIYVIEAKTRSGSGAIDYRSDNELLLGAKINDGPALRQVRGCARAIHFHLKEHLHVSYRVKPVLVFLGDRRVQRGAGDFEVDVVTAAELENYFDRQQPELTRKEIAHICSHLEHVAGA